MSGQASSKLVVAGWNQDPLYPHPSNLELLSAIASITHVAGCTNE
jgi:hypothetical protein